MKTPIQIILLEILTVAGYANDKEKFVREFEELNLIEALTHIYDTLPKENQEQIKANSDPYIIQQYIPKEAYLNEVIKVTRTALADFVKDIAPSLNFYQKEKINTLVVIL